ncbi:MAG: hypothetical protein AAGA97_00665 [Pseudomonadota bacterium]
MRYKFGLNVGESFISSSSVRKLDEAFKTGAGEKPSAKICVTKVMDYYSVFNPTISKAHNNTSFVLFVREPVGLCESLMRSGNSLECAIDWYNSVLRLFWQQKQTAKDTPVFRFEDLLRQPHAFATSVYQTLDLPPPPSGQIKLKKKRFGSARSKNEDATTGWIDVSLKDLADHIDPDVNKRARERLGQTTAQEIISRTSALAERFGYHQDVLVTQ